MKGKEVKKELPLWGFLLTLVGGECRKYISAVFTRRQLAMQCIRWEKNEFSKNIEKAIIFAAKQAGDREGAVLQYVYLLTPN